jgi:hypothetical protein
MSTPSPTLGITAAEVRLATDAAFKEQEDRRAVRLGQWLQVIEAKLTTVMERKELVRQIELVPSEFNKAHPRSPEDYEALAEAVAAQGFSMTTVYGFNENGHPTKVVRISW